MDKLRLIIAGKLGNNFSIRVIDYTGNIVYTNTNTHSFNLAHLANGIYTLQLFSDNGNVTKRIQLIN